MKTEESIDRRNLPYRKNCEGYLLYGNNQVLAQDTGKGYMLFPGGGVDEGETPEAALRREAFEETGVVIAGELKKIGVLHFEWDSGWAKTEKQRSRFHKFKGEEMHFFMGKIRKFRKPEGDPEDIWQGEKLMKIDEAIKSIEANKPFPKRMEEYYNMQLKSLKRLKNHEE